MLNGVDATAVECALIVSLDLGLACKTFRFLGIKAEK